MGTYKLTGGVIARGSGKDRTVVKRNGTIELTPEQARKLNVPGVRRKVVPVEEGTFVPQRQKAGVNALQGEDAWTTDELLEMDIEELKQVAADGEVELGDAEDKAEIIKVLKGTKK
jgi:hypothetical protein